jgi:hypothetical protein
MTNLEIFISGITVTVVFSIGMLFYSLGYNETKNKKPFEIDTDLGATKKYE